MENVVPIVIELKKLLEKHRSPLLGDLMTLLKELVIDYRDEINGSSFLYPSLLQMSLWRISISDLSLYISFCLCVTEILVDKQLIKELEYELQHGKDQRSITPSSTAVSTPPTYTVQTKLHFRFFEPMFRSKLCIAIELM
jgi:hypothetical protein